jgi:hypothetical protein
VDFLKKWSAKEFFGQFFAVDNGIKVGENLPFFSEKER